MAVNLTSHKNKDQHTTTNHVSSHIYVQIFWLFNAIRLSQILPEISTTLY